MFKDLYKKQLQRKKTEDAILIIGFSLGLIFALWIQGLIN